MVKILHTGDIHLDSAFSGLDIAKSESAREEQRNVFQKMMSYAKQNSYDMVLISGDLFDTKYITARTREIVLSSLSELDCPVIIAPGNHDPYYEISLYRGELPSNVYVFSSEEMQVFDFDEIHLSVCGYAFCSDRIDTNPLINFNLPETENNLILCAHADISSKVSKYAPITEDSIENCGFVYAALGHIHNPPEPQRQKSLIRYSGFPLGRSFDEIGDGGALSVTISDGVAKAEKIIFSEQRFVECNLDVSSSESYYDVEKKIKDFLSGSNYGKETLLRITLCGTVALDCNINTERLSKIPNTLGLLKIKNETLALPDAESLKDDITLRGELYRTLLPKLTSEDLETRQTATEALRIGLYALDGKNLAEFLSLEEK